MSLPTRHGHRRKTPSAFTRVRALLAGALVLGVGGTATLAAWTDEEYATAEISAGTFAMESRTTLAEDAWRQHSSEEPAPLQLNAAGLFPGETRAAWIQIRTASESVPGVVALTGVTNGGGGAPTVNPAKALWEGLAAQIGVVENPDACTAAYTGGTHVALGAVPTLEQLPAQQLPGGGAGVVTYCLVVTLSPNTANEAQGGSVAPTWEFTGSTPSE